MKIKFHETMYELIREPYVYQTMFHCVLKKEDYTVDSIIEDSLSPETITVYDDGGTVIGIYTGFTNRIAITIAHDNEIQIQFENTDIQAQIDSLTSQLSSVQESQATTDAAIAELGDTVNSVSEVNDVQDLAIEDLSETVSTITPEEE